MAHCHLHIQLSLATQTSELPSFGVSDIELMTFKGMMMGRNAQKVTTEGAKEKWENPARKDKRRGESTLTTYTAL